MKTKLLVIVTFFITGITVLSVAAHKRYFPENKPPTTATKPSPTATNIPGQLINQQRPKVELVFALDTTGSMGGLIKAAKEKIWSIVSTMASAQPAPEISVGLVAYRDRGDQYVTRIIQLSQDIDTVYAQLLDLQADGGGDAPESVNEALHQAVTGIKWSNNNDSYKVIFLVGDAPGHNNYANDTPFQVSIERAKQKGIIINTIQAGQDPTTKLQWQQVASLGAGAMFQVGQQGSSLAINTPFDEAIALASKELDESKLYFGDKQQKQHYLKKQKAADKLNAMASSAALARRAKFNATDSGARNFADDGELVQAIESNKIKLSAIKEEQLPEAMKIMEQEERETFIQQKISERKNTQQRIRKLNEKRDDYIRQALKNTKNTSESLDAKLFDTLRTQAKEKGIEYTENNATY